MKEAIIDSIYHLYRGLVVTLILYILLCCIMMFGVVGAIKFNLIKSKLQRISILIIACLCCVILLMVQIVVYLAPVRTDYKESSYVILENATMTITSDAVGTLDPINYVTVTDHDGKRYDLKMQNDRLLSCGSSYTGTIVYLKHSEYVVWYDIDQ